MSFCKSGHFMQSLAISILVVSLASCVTSQSSTVPNNPVNQASTQTVQDDVSITSTPVVPVEAARLPDYLDQVWPKPGSVVSKESYNASFKNGPIQVGSTGIGVVFWADRIAAQDGDIDVNWFTRCSLLVDGVSAPSEGLAEDGALLIEKKDALGHLLYRTSGPYFRVWFVPLEAGTHAVTFQIQRTTGEILEYGWSFTIIP